MTTITPIETPSLRLREFTLADRSKVYRMSREAGLQQWLPDQVYRDEHHTSEVLASLMAWYVTLEPPTEVPCVLGVCLRESGELIGHVGLSPLRGQAEIGLAIEEQAQGRGHATEAARAMARWGHETFDLPVILGVVASGNFRSCRVLEKSGFVLASEEPGCLHGWSGLIRTYESTKS